MSDTVSDTVSDTGGQLKISEPANKPSIANTIATLSAVPTRSPSQVATPALPATRTSRFARYSPIAAPASGRNRSPTKPVNTPATVPIAAPAIAHGLAPTRFAPAAPAARSTIHESAARMPAAATTHHEMRAKSSIQAASAMPANTSVGPGSAGRIVPATPIAIIATASTHRNTVIGPRAPSLRVHRSMAAAGRRSSHTRPPPGRRPVGPPARRPDRDISVCGAALRRTPRASTRGAQGAARRVPAPARPATARSPRPPRVRPGRR